jgi:hypothetical protein
MVLGIFETVICSLILNSNIIIMSDTSVDELIDEMKRMILKIGTAEEKKKIEEEFRTLEEEAGKSDVDVQTFRLAATNLKKKCLDVFRKTNRAALVEAMDFTLCRSGEEKTLTKKKKKTNRFAQFASCLKRIRALVDRATYLKALKALRLFVKNLVQHPDEPKYRSVRVQNKVFQKRVGVLDGGLECMESIGFVKVTKSDGTQYLEIESTSKESKMFLKRVLVVLENAVKTATSLKE